MPTRVALVEDVPALRQRLVERLQFFDTVQITLISESGDACLDALARITPAERPEVVLMDIEMPGLDGIETTRLLRDRYPDIEVMMLTVFEDEERIFGAIQAGASGYLLKDTSADALVAAIEELRSGGAPLSPVIARKMLSLVRHDAAPLVPESGPDASEAFALSRREIDVLRAIVEADTEREIADRLFVSLHTVRTHVKNIYRKLHVHSRAEAVRLALERRLV